MRNDPHLCEDYSCNRLSCVIGVLLRIAAGEAAALIIVFQYLPQASAWFDWTMGICNILFICTVNLIIALNDRIYAVHYTGCHAGRTQEPPQSPYRPFMF